jgi:hypothetical protein
MTAKQENECILEEAQAKEVQTKETVRKILAQVSCAFCCGDFSAIS